MGARTARNGVGAHLARHFAQAGAHVRAVLGTTRATASQAASALGAHLPEPAAYVDPDRLWRDVAPDLVVIASPPPTHADFLARALRMRTHVLCEKPVAHGTPRPGPTWAPRFVGAGLHLVVHAQWPFTLPTYRALHPDARPERATRFAMHLAPRHRGIAGVEDSLSHPLSLLAAVCPGPDARVEQVSVSRDDATWRVAFDYVVAPRRIACTVTLSPGAAPPRPAAYAFDGAWAHRTIGTNYSMKLNAAGGAVPSGEAPVGEGIVLPDPSALLVRSVVERVAQGAPVHVDPALVPGARLLDALCQAARLSESLA